MSDPADSTAPGTLRPSSPDPLLGQAFDVLLGGWIVALTGLAGSLVRPRWQEAPPAMPPQGTDWCAIGKTGSTPDAGPWIACDGSEPGNVIMQRHEDVDALATFYGPNAENYAELVRDGAQFSQNRTVLAAQGVALVSMGATRIVPEIQNQIWVYRADLPIALRRVVTRIYPVRALEPFPAPVTILNSPT